MLAFELTMLKARKNMDTEDGRDYLERMQLLEADEWDKMVPGERNSTVFLWLQMAIMELEKRCNMDIEYVLMLSSALAEMRDQSNDLLAHVYRDQPFPYSALCGLLVHLNVLIFTTANAVEWSIWLYASGLEIFTQPRIYCDIFTVFVWNISYTALYDLGYFLNNPFGPRRVDIAHEHITRGLRKLTDRFVHGLSCIPNMHIKLKREDDHLLKSGPDHPAFCMPHSLP
jgi:hypothetical protein